MDRTPESDIAVSKEKLPAKVLELLRARNNRALFMTELYASLARLRVDRTEVEGAVTRLEAEGALMVRDHFCADPHLAGVDLRVVARVEKKDGDDPAIAAMRRIDEAWNKWLNEYLANHRCG